MWKVNLSKYFALLVYFLFQAMKMGKHMYLRPCCCLIFYLIISNIIWIDSYPTSPYFLFFRQFPKLRWVHRALYWNNSKSKSIFKDWNLPDVHSLFIYLNSQHLVFCILHLLYLLQKIFYFKNSIYNFYIIACISFLAYVPLFNLKLLINNLNDSQT